MGGSSSQTVGYRYCLSLHAVFTHGPVDSFKRITFDDTRIAWKGSANGGTVVIDKTKLFGGDDREGGVSGLVDVMTGEPDQTANSHLVSLLGPLVPAFRLVSGLVFRGGSGYGYGSAFNFGNSPYLKKFAARIQRIHKTTDGATQWYDEKAAIPVPSSIVTSESGTFFVAANSPVANSGTVYGLWPHGDYYGTAQDIADKCVALRNATTGSSFELGGVPQFNTVTGGLVGTIKTNSAIGLAGVIASPTCLTDGLTPSVSGDVGPLGLQNAVVTCTGASEFDMNPAHIIREALTNPDWGMGYNESDVDDDSFTVAADALYAEGMGISILWDRQIAIEEFIKEIIKHIDAALYVDRTTGKFTLKLIRKDYDEGSLLVLNDDNVDRVADYKRAAFGELVTSVTVNYWDGKTGTDASLTIQDDALAQMQGAAINTTLQYPGFTHSGIAGRVAQRDLATLSYPLISCTVYADRDADSLTVADVFKLDWPDLQISNLVMRITGIAYGDGRSNKVRITCTQDVFSLPEAAFITPSDPIWEDPNSEPEPAERRLILELPYLELVQQQGQTNVDSALATSPDIGIVGMAAGRPGNAINALLYTNAGAGFTEANILDYSPTCVLQYPVDRNATVLQLSEVVDSGLIEVGKWLQIDNEIMAVVSLDENNTLVVKRGCLDTVPALHLAGAIGYFWDNYASVDPTEYATGESVEAKVLVKTGLGELDLADAPIDSITLASRAVRPYPPGNLKVNSEYFPELITGEVDLTWAHRDRKQQTSGNLNSFLDGDIGPEDGTSYTVKFYDEFDTLVYEESGILGTSFSFTGLLEAGSGAPSDTALYDKIMSFGPRAYWRFDETSGSLLNDQTVNNFDLAIAAGGGAVTYERPSLAYSTTNAAMKFNASYAGVATSIFTLNSSWTICVIVNGPSFTGNPCIWHKGDFAAGGNQGLTCQMITTGALSFQYYNGGWRNVTTASGFVPTDKPAFVTVRYTGGTTLDVICNGVKQSLALPIALPANTSSFYVGATRSGSTFANRLTSDIDELFVIQSALSDAVIEEVYDLITPAGAAINGKLRFELNAVRDGFESWQKHDVTVYRQGYGYRYGSDYGARAGYGRQYGQSFGV